MYQEGFCFLQFSVIIRVNLKNIMLSCIFHIMAFYCVCGLTQFLEMASYKKDVKIMGRSMAFGNCSISLEL